MKGRDNNNIANTHLSYTIPRGVKVMNKVMSNPNISTSLNSVVPRMIPNLGSLKDPRNPYAVNGLISRLGTPIGHKK